VGPLSLPVKTVCVTIQRRKLHLQPRQTHRRRKLLTTGINGAGRMPQLFSSNDLEKTQQPRVRDLALAHCRTPSYLKDIRGQQR
jgi:hypothetical protein